jgi:hypothetical protein
MLIRYANGDVGEAVGNTFHFWSLAKRTRLENLQSSHI